MREQRKYYDGVLLRLVNDAVATGAFRERVDGKFAANFIMSAISSLPDWYRPQGRRPPLAVAEVYADMAMGVLGALVTTGQLDVQSDGAI